MPNVVGAIDGTSHPIFRPSVVDQAEFYSGNRHYHCFHTMVIMSNNFRIVMARGGWTGRNNDAGIFNLMRHQVNLPRNLYLLGDLIFANAHPIITPYNRRELNAVRNTPLYDQRVEINQRIRHRRPRVENIIKFIKDFEILHYMFRHDRDEQARVVNIIAGLSNRRLAMFDEL